ncbi:uncharacterized protein DNG_08214 [Cephalotrichum gorgonifer]|uniref:Ubiquinol-cytochrome-c reductase complex assembly factor 2 n=1 Tax=Cephalotrichum gorgonifer TaxID=2041049 RepID=A0AAE8N3X3_9PEZI|nr:uncharacterized protein DNG_08214 [Cephalotrichum gorgonifer]
MSRPVGAALQRYQRVLSQWPVDKLRPNTQLQDVLQKALDKKYDPKAATAPDEAAELKQANALLTLLNDGYKKKYPLRTILTPKSQPTYFQDLLEELERAPEKTFSTRLWEKISGYIRFK